MSDIPKYKDEYWDAALETLKREERKAAIKRWLPLFFVISGAGAIILLLIHFSAEPRAIVAYQSGEPIELTKPNTIPSQQFEQIKIEVSNSDVVDRKSTIQTKQPDPAVLQSENVEDQYQEVIAQEVDVLEQYKMNTDETDLESEDGLSKQKSVFPKPGEKYTGVDEHKVENTFSMFKSSARSPMTRMKSIELASGIMLNRIPLGRKGNTGYRFNKMLLRTNHLFASIGSSIFPGFGASNSDLRFNPELSLGYAYQLDPRWSLTAGLSYFEIGGIRHSVDVDQISLGFDATVNRTSISTDKLIYLGLPIQLDWNIDMRNSIGLSWNSSVLLTSASTVSRGQPGESFDSQEGEHGYVEGYESLIHALGINYKFRLNNRWTANLEYQYGLNTTTNEEVYENTGNDRASRAVVRIKYQIRP